MTLVDFKFWIAKYHANQSTNAYFDVIHSFKIYTLSVVDLTLE